MNNKGEMDLNTIKREINLIEYARKYGISCNSQGKTICPFHPDEKNPSFEIRQHNGVWTFKDWHDDETGSIVDLVARMENVSDKEACQKLLKEFDSGNSMEHAKKKLEIEREHIYRDSEGQPVIKKVKYKKNSLNITWGIMHMGQNGKWQSGKGSHELHVYNLDKFKDHTSAIICEGEKDADTIEALNLGLLATSAPTGKGAWPESINKYFKQFKEVTFLYDVGNDEDVAKHATKLKKALAELDIYIARIPLEKKEADITDYLNQEQMKDMALLSVLDGKKKFEVTENKPNPILTNLENISPEPVDWLWWNRIPLGKLTLVVGDPGQGKSFLALYLAAHVTTGRPWPDIGAPIPEGSVILLTAEDGIADTVRVRADSMEADVNRIYVFEGVKNPDEDEPEFFNLTRHISILEKAIKKIKDVRMVIIDPITAYLGNVEDNRNASIRAVLAPVAALAEKEKIAIISISHLNKDVAKRAIYRAMGSVAFIAAARAVWAVSKDENDETHSRRFLTPLKTNLSINPSGLAFSITDKGIVFETNPIDITIEEALAPPQEIEEPWAIKEAIEFLTEVFKDNQPIPANDVKKQAKENDISISTLKRAKQKLNIYSVKKGVKNWVWVKER